MSVKPYNILIVDDDLKVVSFMEDVFQILGNQSIIAHDPFSAYDIYKKTNPDIIFTDVNFPKGSGFDLLYKVLNDDPQQEIILMTTFDDMNLAVKALREGASDLLSKPLTSEMLEVALSRCRMRINKNQMIKSAFTDLENMVKERTQELEDANQKLQTAYENLDILSNMKSEFIAFISHELRTPLTSLSAFRLINLENLSGEEKDIINIISDGYSRLDTLVKKAIDYFKIVAHIPFFKPELFNVSQLLSTLLEYKQKYITDKKISVEVEMDNDLKIIADSETISKIFETLIDNAINFNSFEGKIKIFAKVVDSKFIFQISDTGIGLSKEGCESIFSAFAIQNINFHSRGSGLNLPIVKNYIHYLGGEISASSPGQNQGTSLHFELPLDSETKRRY